MFSAPAPGALPPALAQNPTWQQVNKEINANLKLDLAGTTLSASTKLATIVAGGALPDMLSLGPNPLLANLPAFLEASCADLTPLLSGDAVKAYPNLANYPTYAWQAPGVVYNNKIFAVPVARAIGGNALQVHQQAAAKYDIGPIKSAADFKKALQRATNPKAGVWGISDQTMTFTPLLAAQIFGAPNNWKLESGKLIKDYETEEYKAGIGFLRDLWAAGVYHPYFSTDEGDAFVGGQFVFYYFIEDSFHYSWELVLSKKAVDKLTLIPPFSQDGTSKPQYFLGRGNFGGTVLKKASPDRVKELLSVLNFFGAPFGSQEDLLLTYGIENTDFTFDSMGNPTPKPNGFAKHRVPWAFYTHGPAVTYDPVDSQPFATLVHGSEEMAIPVGVQDATWGLYSSTDGQKGAVAKKTIGDGITGIVTGRQPLSDWNQLVKNWQTTAGNQIRDEYAKALAARSGY